MKQFIKENIVFLSLIFSSGVISFGNETQSQTYKIYLRCVSKQNDAEVDTVHISYNLYYPNHQFVRKLVLLKKESFTKIIPVTIETVALFFEESRFRGNLMLLVEPGDTVEFSIDKNGYFLIQGKNMEYQKFEEYRKERFGNEFQNLLKLISDTSRNAVELTNILLQFSEKERRLIDSVYGQDKLTVKNFLIQKSFFDFIWYYREIFKQRNFTRVDSAFIFSKTTSIEFLNNPGEVFDYSYSNAIFKYAELISGQSQTEIAPEKLKAVFNYSKLNYSFRAYKFLLLRLLDITALISSPLYDHLVNEIYSELNKISFSEDERQKIRKVYMKALVASKDLKSMQNLELQKAIGKSVKLKDIIKPGKIYLLDFWASWCLPCIEEFPFINKMAKDYPQLQMISISIDSDREKWLKAVNKYNKSEANEFWIGSISDNKLLKNYQITNIPRFLLFESNGKCITSNSPRPSEKEFYDLIASYLNKKSK